VGLGRARRRGRAALLAVGGRCGGRCGRRGTARLERVGATPSFRGDAVVHGLLSDLRSLDEPLVPVIDDLHELRSADALRLLEHFLSELPPGLRVALATRQDPGLGLHRLRLTDRLTEVRAGDLRFSLDETRRLLAADGIALADEPWRCCTNAPRVGWPGCAWRRSRSRSIPIRSAS
jgi:hypothetical protein